MLQNCAFPAYKLTLFSTPPYQSLILPLDDHTNPTGKTKHLVNLKTNSNGLNKLEYARIRYLTNNMVGRKDISPTTNFACKENCGTISLS